MGRTVRREGFPGPSRGKLQGHSGERRLWSGSGKRLPLHTVQWCCRQGAVGLAETRRGPICKGDGGRKRIDLRYFYFSSIFPAHVALSYFSLQKLFNTRSYNTSLRYLISGPGVDEPPEVGLFSIEDDAKAHVYVHRTIDRERTPAFQVTHLDRTLPADCKGSLMAKCFTGMGHTYNNVKCVFS